tara:strand:- start:219 stop:719 length:501 start_codon:yes stop_codon:yes gene_type:complete
VDRREPRDHVQPHVGLVVAEQRQEQGQHDVRRRRRAERRRQVRGALRERRAHARAHVARERVDGRREAVEGVARRARRVHGLGDVQGRRGADLGLGVRHELRVSRAQRRRRVEAPRERRERVGQRVPRAPGRVLAEGEQQREHDVGPAGRVETCAGSEVMGRTSHG